MSKLKFLAPQDLIKDSKKLDIAIKGRKWRMFFMCLAFVIYVGGAFLITLFGQGILVIWLISIAALFIVAHIINKKTKISEREFISFCLYKIYKGLEEGKLEEKYLKLLNKKTEYLNQEEIEKRDKVFKDFELRKESFFENMHNLPLKINHAHKNNQLDEFSADEIGELSRMIYYNSGKFLELSNKISRPYRGSEKFPGLLDYAKSIGNKKTILFLILESIVILILWFIYSFFYSNKGIVLNGFFILTAAAAAATISVSKKD